MDSTLSKTILSESTLRNFLPKFAAPQLHIARSVFSQNIFMMYYLNQQHIYIEVGKIVKRQLNKIVQSKISFNQYNHLYA